MLLPCCTDMPSSRPESDHPDGLIWSLILFCYLLIIRDCHWAAVWFKPIMHEGQRFTATNASSARTPTPAGTKCQGHGDRHALLFQLDSLTQWCSILIWGCHITLPLKWEDDDGCSLLSSLVLGAMPRNKGIATILGSAEKEAWVPQAVLGRKWVRRWFSKDMVCFST